LHCNLCEVVSLARKRVVDGVFFQDTTVSDFHILELWMVHLVVEMLLIWRNEGGVKCIHMLVNFFNGDVFPTPAV
jgi:hypothetical protein